MPVDPRWEDVAAISTKTNYGSARLFAPNLLVTAAHVLNDLAPDQHVNVLLLSDRKPDGSWPTPRKARRVWQGIPKADMALVELFDDPPIIPVMEASFASLDFVEEVRTLAIGFPEGWRPGGVFRPYPAFGQLRPADVEGGYLWTVGAADNPDNVTDWKGLSGASLVALLGANRLLLFGVIEEVPANFSGGMLKVVDFVAPQRMAGFSLLTGSTRTYAWRNGTPALRIVVRAEGADEEEGAPPPRYRANWEPLIDDCLAVGHDGGRDPDIVLDSADFDAMMNRVDSDFRNIKHKYASNLQLVTDITRNYHTCKAVAGRVPGDAKSVVAYLSDSGIEKRYWGDALSNYLSLMVNQAFSSFYTGFFDGDKSHKSIVARTLSLQLNELVLVDIWAVNTRPLKVMAPVSFLNSVKELVNTGTILSKGVENPNPAITALMSSIKEWDYLFTWQEKTEFWAHYVVPQAFAFGFPKSLPRTPHTVLNIGLA